MQSWVVYSPCTHPRCVPGADPGLECGRASAPSLGPVYRLWSHMLVLAEAELVFFTMCTPLIWEYILDLFNDKWLHHLPQVASCHVWHPSVPWTGLDQPSEGSAIKGSIWWAAVTGWGGCETAQQTSLMCGTASLSSPDNLECHPFHSHFLHTDYMEKHRRDSFTSLTPPTSGIYGCMLL